MISNIVELLCWLGVFVAILVLFWAVELVVGALVNRFGTPQTGYRRRGPIPTSGL